MKIGKNELKVFYHGEINENLDIALEKILQGFGYAFWASGTDLKESVRDLAFDKKVSDV